MNKFRELLKGAGGLVLAGLVVVAGLMTLYFMSFAATGESSAVYNSTHRWYVDAETGKPFQVHLVAGMAMPPKSPDTGNPTGVEAELCYWTAEGKLKDQPDPVLLNGLRSPPVRGPTFCPICHRLVIENNPMPLPGISPPPTEVEYKRSPSNYASLFQRR